MDVGDFASMVTHVLMSWTMAMPVMRSVGGISIVRPSSVRNWLLRLSFPLTNGVR